MLNFSMLQERPVSPYPLHPFTVLEKESVVSFFEPILSVQKMDVIGLEVEGRAFDPGDGKWIEPGDLFRQMTRQDSVLKLSLDRLFRQKGLEGFSQLPARRQGLLLFLSVTPSILQEGVVGSGYLLQQVLKSGLDPGQVVVQISLAEEMNELQARKFMEYQHLNGFLTALKDITFSPFHLDALFRFKPDLIQPADRLVKGLSGDFEKQRAFRKMVRLAHSQGILVTAGAVQSEEDGLVALDSGADLLQGKYLSKSYKNNLVFTLNRKDRLAFLSSRFRRRVTNRAKRDRDLWDKCRWTADSIFKRLETPPTGLIDRKSSTLFNDFPSLECLYLLDGEGVQVCETVCSQYHIPERKKLLFKPSPQGSDHSFREYFYALSPVRNRHLTEPHLSMNSGNLCVTAAQWTLSETGDTFILCADINLSKF